MAEDIIDLSPTKEEIIVQRKGKENAVEKTEVQLLKEQLRESREEVIETKLELEEAMLDRKIMEEFKEKVNEQINHYDYSSTDAKNLLKRTLSLCKGMKHTRKRNIWLQEKRKKLKIQVKDLEEQMEMIQSELKKQGLKITVIDEPEETQAPTAKGEASKA